MTPLMTHIVAGYPSLQESEDLAMAMIEAGVEYLEIQIPFTDPVADGPVIAEANHVSLANGTKLQDCFDLMKTIRSKTDIPLFFMSYYNIPFVYGLDTFCKTAKEHGCSGLIIPDIPYDEEPNTHYLEITEKYDLSPILIVTPLTPDERLKEIGAKSKSMIYCVSGVGTTGKKQSFNQETKAYLDNVRKYTDLPLALGFGVSSKEDIANAGAIADIVVIGSQVIRSYEEGGLKEVQKLVSH